MGKTMVLQNKKTYGTIEKKKNYGTMEKNYCTIVNYNKLQETIVYTVAQCLSLTFL